MLSVLHWAELTGLFAAMSVVAWLRYPSRDTDLRLAYLRFAGPVVAILSGIMATNSLHRRLSERALSAPQPDGWGLVLGGFVACAVAWAISEVRQSRRSRRIRRWLASWQESWSRDGVAAPQRARPRPTGRRKKGH